MAYEVLSDPDMRKRYDQFGKDGLEEGAMHNPEVRKIFLYQRLRAAGLL